MRYIGNKTRLLGFIRRILRSRGVTSGAAVDPFCGTASVARELKRLGFQVVASDIMHYAYVFAKAYVETAREPEWRPLADAIGARRPTLQHVLQQLNRLPGSASFITTHYSTAGEAHSPDARMYFTRENGARIDNLRERLHRWRAAGIVDETGYFVLLSALLEASDRVANTTGVYAAYVKSWQPNALRPLELRPPRLHYGNGCHAHQQDASALVASLEPFDVLYLDPPYNARQYAGYYHVPELIALGWFQEQPALRGKTGLLPDTEKRSDWSRRSRCEDALEKLLAAARCKHVVMSYNAEGIIPEPAIERLLRSYGRRATYKRYTMTYRRYRSDSDHEKRRYSGDVVREHLYCVAR